MNLPKVKGENNKDLIENKENQGVFIRVNDKQGTGVLISKHEPGVTGEQVNTTEN